MCAGVPNGVSLYPAAEGIQADVFLLLPSLDGGKLKEYSKRIQTEEDKDPKIPIDEGLVKLLRKCIRNWDAGMGMKKMREREIFSCAEKLAVPELDEERIDRASRQQFCIFIWRQRMQEMRRIPAAAKVICWCCKPAAVYNGGASSNPKNGHWLTELLPSPLD